MKNFIDKSVILWDFDGVILDSMPIRKFGFEKVLEDYPKDQVNSLLDFHAKNGGLSRYVKFRYFFENIRNEELSEKKLKELTEAYSTIMRKELVARDRLIPQTIEFIKRNQENYKMHIVSGSDGEELRTLCEKLNISSYFNSIAGSPTPKKELVGTLIDERNYKPGDLCLIGDSINDLEAAEINKIDFFGFNNSALKGKGAGYINSFS